MNKSIFDVAGMRCAACSARIEKVLVQKVGIISVTANINTNKVSVVYDDNVSINDIITMFEKIGYLAELEIKYDIKQQKQLHEIKKLKINLIISVLLTLPLIFAMVLHMLNIPTILTNGWIQLLLATPVQFYIGASFYKSAFHTLRNGGANMDVLIVIGTSSAYFYSIYQLLQNKHHFYFESSAVIITLILLGKLFELLAKNKTNTAIMELIQLAPTVANKIINKDISCVSIEELHVNDIVLVRAGERIPIDGIIIEGSSDIEEAMITGEAIPVYKTKDDFVYGGTINGLGLLKIKVIKTADDTVLAHIVEMIDQASMSKAPIQRLADKVSSIFVPIVLVIALLTLIINLLVQKQFDSSIMNAIAVLVIACPCALGLATPTAIMVGIGRGTKSGILIKNGEVLEKVHQLDTIIFDKTGTITHGKPFVTEILSINISENELLRITASIERYSEHPLAKAIIKKAEDEMVIFDEVENFQTVVGQGVFATIQKKKYFIGTKSLLEEQNIDIKSYDEMIKHFSQAGKTVIFISDQQQLLGLFVIADTIKATSYGAVNKLKKLGIKTIMLTGDNYQSANMIAQEVGIDEYYAQVLPNSKAEKVQQLSKIGNIVGMVGDGINDAPALANANVSFAIGSGSDIAIETADITLMNSDLNGVGTAIVLSKATIRIIKQNLFWAFFYNVIGICFAAFGFLDPMIAGLAMAFSSVSVIMNSLRLKNIKL